eukprot:Opistho-2@62033
MQGHTMANGRRFPRRLAGTLRRLFFRRMRRPTTSCRNLHCDGVNLPMTAHRRHLNRNRRTLCRFRVVVVARHSGNSLCRSVRLQTTLPRTFRRPMPVRPRRPPRPTAPRAGLHPFTAHSRLSTGTTVARTRQPLRLLPSSPDPAPPDSCRPTDLSLRAGAFRPRAGRARSSWRWMAFASAVPRRKWRVRKACQHRLPPEPRPTNSWTSLAVLHRSQRQSLRTQATSGLSMIFSVGLAAYPCQAPPYRAHSRDRPPAATRSLGTSFRSTLLLRWALHKRPLPLPWVRRVCFLSIRRHPVWAWPAAWHPVWAWAPLDSPACDLNSACRNSTALVWALRLVWAWEAWGHSLPLLPWGQGWDGPGSRRRCSRSVRNSSSSNSPRQPLRSTPLQTSRALGAAVAVPSPPVLPLPPGRRLASIPRRVHRRRGRREDSATLGREWVRSPKCKCRSSSTFLDPITM